MTFSPAVAPPANKLLRSKLFWISLLYFSEGFPLGLFFDLFPVYFRQQGIELSQIGLLSLLGLAWTLKFLWAPLVDYTRHHRYWMAAANLGMGLVMIAVARDAGFGPWVWFAIAMFTALSATNDIAIDGYTIERLNKDELGRANGFRIGFYRVGMLAAGVLLWMSDVAGWTNTYLLAACLFAVLAVTMLLAPKEPPRPARAEPGKLADELRTLGRQPILIVALGLFLAGLLWPVLGALNIEALKPVKGTWWFKGAIPVGLILLSAVLFARGLQRRNGEAAQAARGPMFGAIISLLNRKNAMLLIVFILIFKLADSSIGFMIKPFWVDSGFTNKQIGMVSVNLGLALSIAGGIVGGWYTDRVGIFRGLWVLGLWQALSNLGYVTAAFMVPPMPQGTEILLEHKLLMYGASAIESFTGGLGTAAFLAFLMAIVDKAHATTEYALLSSIFAFSRSIAGWAGGIGAQEMGYAGYFTLTFLLAFPAYALLPWIKAMLQTAEENQGPSG